MPGTGKNHLSVIKDHGRGYVPIENLVGRAQIIFLSVADRALAWHVLSWAWSMRWNRLFDSIM